MPPIVIIRQLTKAYDYNTGESDEMEWQIGPRNSKWFSVEPDNPFYYKSSNSSFFRYIMDNLGKYLRAGSIGCYSGQGGLYSADDGSGLPNPCTIMQFSGSGCRVFNNEKDDIVYMGQQYTVSAGSEDSWNKASYPPYVDIIYIRRDILSYAY